MYLNRCISAAEGEKEKPFFFLFVRPHTITYLIISRHIRTVMSPDCGSARALNGLQLNSGRTSFMRHSSSLNYHSERFTLTFKHIYTPSSSPLWLQETRTFELNSDVISPPRGQASWQICFISLSVGMKFISVNVSMQKNLENILVL